MIVRRLVTRVANAKTPKKVLEPQSGKVVLEVFAKINQVDSLEGEKTGRHFTLSIFFGDNLK